MVIDSDTVSLLCSGLSRGCDRIVARSAGVALPIAVLLWWIDPIRVRRRIARARRCGLPRRADRLVPRDADGPRARRSTTAITSRSSPAPGSLRCSILSTHGLLESDRPLPSGRRRRLRRCVHARAGRAAHHPACTTSSSFDIRVVPGIKVPQDYGSHFLSFDGKERKFLVEGAGGPTLVYRIQCADRPVGALLRPLRRFRDADCRRPRRRAACRTRSRTAAITPTASIHGSAPF